MKSIWCHSLEHFKDTGRGVVMSVIYGVRMPAIIQLVNPLKSMDGVEG